MNRRNLFKKAGVASASVFALSSFGRALADEHAEEIPQCLPTNKLELAAVIGRNHGHDLQLSSEDVLVLLASQEMKAEGQVVIDIQGTSRHPHTIALSREDLLTLASEQEVSVLSSEDFRHTHTVDITLAEVVIPDEEVEEI